MTPKTPMQSSWTEPLRLERDQSEIESKVNSMSGILFSCNKITDYTFNLSHFTYSLAGLYSQSFLKGQQTVFLICISATTKWRAAQRYPHCCGWAFFFGAATAAGYYAVVCLRLILQHMPMPHNSLSLSKLGN